MHEDGLDFSQA